MSAFPLAAEMPETAPPFAIEIPSSFTLPTRQLKLLAFRKDYDLGSPSSLTVSSQKAKYAMAARAASPAASTSQSPYRARKSRRAR
jgi:hypothetical protein